MYRGWLTIPYLTPTGVIAIKVRRIEDNTERPAPKYVQLEGEGSHLYNVRDLQKPSPFIVIAEGEIDAATVSGMAGVPCVAVPGVANAKDEDSGKVKWSDPSVMRRIFEDYNFVIVLFDGDDAGRKAADRIKKAIPRAQIVAMPEGMDANSIFLRDGAEGLRKLLGVKT